MSDPKDKVSKSPVQPPPAGPEASPPDLKIESLLVDPANTEDPQQHVKKWKDNSYRLQNGKMDYAIEMVQRYVSGDAKVTKEKVIKAIEDWKASPQFEKDPANKVVLSNLLGQLAKAKDTEAGKAVLGALPGGEAVLNPPKPEAKKDEKKDGDRFSMSKYYNFGISLRQDTGLLWVFDQMGVPISAFAADQQHINGRLSLDFPMADHVGMVRLNGGVFRLRGIPNSPIDPNEKVDPGLGYRVGADFGIVDPSSKSHLVSGIGIELTGIASHAGQETGIKTPGPLPRLHFFKQSEIPINIGNFQLGIGSFFNQQETYFPLGSGEPLLEGYQGTPVAVTSSLFARNSIPWLVLSGRYYWNGMPDFNAFDPNGPMSNGEATAKLVGLLPTEFILYNRNRDAAAFATNQVFMSLGNGPLGPKGSRDQFDTLSVGLFAYSVLDGISIAGNADARADILLRAPSWWHKGLAIGEKGGFFLWHVIGAATREGDPPYGNIPEFVKNPGSVTDFDGRANNNLWKLDIWDGALTGITYGLEVGTSKKGLQLTGDESTDAAIKKDRMIYRAIGGSAAGVGLLGVLLAGGIAGQGCGSEGTLLACTFLGTREKHFAPGQDFGPETYHAIDNHYVISGVFSSLIPWGVGKLFYSPPDPPQKGGNSTASYKPSVNLRLELTPSRFFAGAEGKF